MDYLSEKTTALISQKEIEDLFARSFNNLPSQNHPEFFGIAGGTAAGKSTLFKKLKIDGQLPTDAYLHDPDEVMLALSLYQKTFKEKGAVIAQQLFDAPALDIAEAMLKYALSNRKNIIYMRTFAADTIFDQLETVQNQGYRLTTLHGVFANLELIKERILHRTIADGRTFPLDTAILRTQKFMENFPQCATFFEKTLKWENNDQLTLV